jgi:hypothetical protein
MDYSDTMNVIPFKVENGEEKMTRHGLELRYIHDTMELYVILRYRKLNGREQLESHFMDRFIAVIDNILLDDSYPLHATTSIFGYKLESINLTT